MNLDKKSNKSVGNATGAMILLIAVVSWLPFLFLLFFRNFDVLYMFISAFISYEVMVFLIDAIKDAHDED